MQLGKLSAGQPSPLSRAAQAGGTAPEAPQAPVTMAADQLTLASTPTAGVDPALVTEIATLRGMVEKIQAAIAAIEAKMPPAAPAEPPAAEPPAPEAPAAAVAEPAPAEEAPKPAPEAEAPKPAEPAPAPAPETYTVVGGDSLSGIAGRVLGDINRWREIYDLNKDAIGENPDLIFPGLALKLPGGAPAAPAPAPAAPPPEAAAPAPAPAAPPPPPPAGPTYTVQSGDSLSGIAGKTLNDINRWGEIFELNRDQVSDPGQIFAGQVLKLPNGATAPAPAAPSGPANGVNTDRNAIYVKQPNNWTCGPTSLTMAAAAFGVRPANHGTVEELTAMTRTRPEYGIPDNTQIPNAARAMGLQASDSHGSSPAAVRAALQAGRGVVLNGSLGSGGHFLYVAGLNPDGSFIICDPWRPEITRMNDGELDHFAHNNPGHGNMVEIWR